MNRQAPEAARPMPPRLQVGGTLIPGRHIYIARPEDKQLFELLAAGEYVNILSSRQVGKSSLMLSTTFRLREHGHRFAVVDLTSLGTPENPRSYFRGLVGAIAKQLELQFDAQDFWQEGADTETNSQQFIRFFRDTIATQIGAAVVICLDEIDSTLKFPYTDDLFTALRSMYNERALVEAYQRITFCLVGVATPDELIKDRRTTPYNVGKTLWLGDFDAARDNLAPLVQVLNDDLRRGQELLRRVLYWTGGHPFLTTKLCQDLRTAGVAVVEDVDRFVRECYDTLEGLSEDVHFQQILRFLKERLTDGLASFDLYERILNGKKERDQPNLAYAELKLSGLVKRDANGVLVPRNRIYQRLFDLEWVQKSRPKQEVKRYRRLAYAAAAVIVVGLVAVGGYYWEVVAPLQSQDEARKELERLQVTLRGDASGLTEVGLPGQDAPRALEQAIPHLVTISSGPGGQPLSLDLSGVDKIDLKTLAPLTGLQRLSLMETKVDDLSPLAELSGLQELDISSTPVNDLAALAPRVFSRPQFRPPNLKRLSAGMTGVKDLGPLNHSAKLESLDVSATPVTDLTPLAKVTTLQRLDVSSTQVKDLAPLIGLTRLTELNISRTAVEDLSPLGNLKDLRTLALDGLGITDFNADGRIPDLNVSQDPAPRKAGAAYRRGESFRECRDCPQLVVVPAGRFNMGSPKDEAGRNDDEQPQHPVTFAQPFAVGKYEVRFDEWLLCVQAGRCRPVPDEGWGRSLRPVINVSWGDAKRYVDWLADKTGQPYRFLTEAEWEYAARADTKAPRYWSEQENACTYASVYDAQGQNKYKLGWGSFNCDDGYPDTAPVGAFQSNAFGLYDMLGNVWEWVADCYHDSYQRAPVDGSAWVTKDCELRVIRGGGWDSGPRRVRSANRDRVSPVDRYDGLGFRVARTLTP